MRKVVLLVLIGCGGSGGGDGAWEARSLTDEGGVCLEAAADGEGSVVVDAQVCLSSSCDREATGSCEATLDGTTITVTSQFDWETATGNQACTDDCGFLGADCTVGPLPAGEYTLVHGDSTTTVTVPTTDDCAGF